MRGWTKFAWIAAFVGVGCAAETGTGESTSALVNKADVESQLLFIDEAIWSEPLTAAEAGPEATPVRIRFYDSYAVAWFAPEGEILSETAENAVAAWDILEHAETTDGEVVSPGGVGVDVPPIVTRPRDFDEEHPFAPISVPALALQREGDGLPFARLDWLRNTIGDLVEQLPSAGHPGCL